MGFGIPTLAGAGWVIEQIEYANPGAEGTKTVQYISKNRLKTVSEGHMFIMDFATNLLLVTDEEHHAYWSGTVDDYVQEVHAFQQAVNDLARQQMEEALKDMGPEQRKAMADLGQQMPEATLSLSSPAAGKRPPVRVERTAETSTMIGHKVTKVLVYADGKPYQELWLAKNLSLRGDLDLKRMRSLQAKLTQAVMAELSNQPAVEDDRAYETLFEQGYFLKIVELGEQGEPEAVTEVVRIEQREIEEHAFHAPEGYQRIDLHEFFKGELDKLRRGE
jgi:hypothetical protein